MQWYKMAEDSDDLHELDHSTSRYSIERKKNYINFTIIRITYEDNGIYVCDSKNLNAEKKQPHLCATELRVMGEWELSILRAPQEMFFLHLSPLPPPYEPHIMLLCTHLSPYWWDPFRYNCRCSMAPQRFFARCQPPSSRTTSPPFALACPSCRNASQGLHSPNKSDFSWSWLVMGPAQGVSSQSWSLMPTPGAVCNALVSLKGEGMSSWSPPSTLADTRSCGHAELVPVPREPGTEVELGALPVLLLPGHSNIRQLQSRNTLKDAIIIIQSILLVIFISVPLLLFLDKVSDSLSSSGDVPSFAAAVLTEVSCIPGRTPLGMGTGRHWVWGCCMGVWLAEVGKQASKTACGTAWICLWKRWDLAWGDKAGDRGWGILVGADTQPVTLLSIG